MPELENIQIQSKVSKLVNETKEKGLMNYDDYIKILQHLNEKQIKNIIANCHTRLDRTLPKDWQSYLQNKAETMFNSIPHNLRHLLGCPMIVFRYEKFLNFLSNYQNLETKSDAEVFWEFVESFPTKNYHRAIRVQPETNIDFYFGMITAPKLSEKFLDFGNSTYPPVVGDFEERFTYHIYANRATQGSLVSWTEDASVARLAATDGVEKYDKDWSDNPEAAVMIVSVQGNSFFFLDETEVNQSSDKPIGRESLLVMSLPIRAIKEGGISFNIIKKDKLPKN